MTQCRIKGFLEESYGKFNEDGLTWTIMMEYDNFLEFLVPFMDPAPPAEYVSYLQSNPTLLEQYADVLMYTRPLPRYKWYEPSNFQVIQNDITAVTN